jgi:hypothetical protein
MQFFERRELSGNAFDAIGQLRGSSLLSAIGRISTSADMVAPAGSSSSRKVPRMAWEPTTITSGWPMIWQAVRMACSS